MSYGHSTSTWGGFAFGANINPFLKQFMADALLRGPGLVSFSADAAVAQLNRTIGFAGDGSVRSEGVVSFSGDFFAGRLPTDRYREEETEPAILVQLHLPTGQVNVAGRDLVVGADSYVRRLLNSGKIMRTITEGTDAVKLVLDDSEEQGLRFRDLFDSADPEGSLVRIWLALTDDQASSVATVVPLFEGKVERIAGFTREKVTLRALRAEVMDNRQLGRLVTNTDYPDAPQESVGRMLNLLFGEHELVEGIVVDTNALGRLKFNHFAADAFLRLLEVESFSPSGTVQVRDEQMTYAGRNIASRELTGIVRGVNGTIATDHPRDAEVMEVGLFRVKFLDHATSKFEGFKILDPQGNLGEPVPPPPRIDYALAEAEWDELPQIRSPNIDSLFLRVHFNEVDALNSATDAQFAARENPSYDTFKFASVLTGFELKLNTNTVDLGEPGDIKRVWIAVVHDPDAGGGTSGIASVRSFYLGGKGRVAFPGLGALQLQGFQLVNRDLTPVDIARYDDRTNDRLYDVESVVVPTTPQTLSNDLSPNVLDDGGIWTPFAGCTATGISGSSPANIIDADVDTGGRAWFSTNVEIGNLAGGALRAHLDPVPDLVGRGFTITQATLEVVVKRCIGSGGSSAPLLAYLEDANGKIPGTEVNCRTLSSGGFPSGCISIGSSGEERFETDVTAAINDKLIGFENVTWILEPANTSSGAINCQNVWVAHQFHLIIEATKDPTPPPVIDDKEGITNYFEVTQYVNGEWEFFDDPLRGGVATVFGGLAPSRILEMFWVVEYQPFFQVSGSVPRVFASMRGLAPTGNPADIARSLVNLSPPFGMGLPATAVANEDYNPARAAFLAGGIRADFVVDQQITATELLAQLAAECDFRQTWTNGRHRIIPKPDLGGLTRVDGISKSNTPTALVAFQLYGDDDILENSLSMSRTSFRDIRTRVTGKWGRLPHTDGTLGSLEIIVDSSEVKFGQQETTRLLALIRNRASAEEVLTRMLLRRALPRWTVSFSLPLAGLELKLGDVIELGHTDFGAAALEIEDVSLDTKRFLTVRVKAIVWIS